MIGDVIAGRYELQEVVGTGGMSSVYRAHDRLLERTVALKVLHPHYGSDTEHAQRFRHEARAVAQLSHRSIVTVIDRGESDRTSVHRLRVRRRREPEAALRETRPAARASRRSSSRSRSRAGSHSRTQHGIVHRDVKPQNVLVDAGGNAKVTDFGIARSLDAEHGMTLTGTVLGTSDYLSPEQASGEPVTAATDVYSLGVVLYELLTGDVPFPGENVVAVAMRHLHEPPPSLLERRPDVPVRLAAAVERALAKDPARRFPSMEAFAAELRGCLAEPADARRAADAARAAHGAAPAPPQPPPRRAGRARPARGARRGAASTLLDGSGGGGAGPGPGGSADVTLRGVTAYDPPPGDGKEHDAQAGLATDGNPSTFWSTETYMTPAFGGLKDGVGLVLDAGSAVALHTLTVSTDTPGYTAIVRAGDAPGGPFGDDSQSQTVAAETTFALDGRTARYYVLWITNLGTVDSVHVNEVTGG